MKFAWLANTRPDLLFEISQLVEVTLERFFRSARAHWKRLNTAIRYAHVNMINLKFSEVDHHSIRIVRFSDAAFASNHDLKPQLGRIILLMDDINSGITIIFESYKSHRVAWYVILTKVVAFPNLLDDALALRS